MTAVTYRAAAILAFGGPKEVVLVDRPIPALERDQILVRNRASTVNSGDVRIRAKNVPRGYGVLMSLVFGFRTPRIKVLGTVFAGEVAAIGPDVTEFAIGDQVFGSTELQMGCHAEYVVIKAGHAIAHLPETLTLAEAAAVVFGGTTADYFLDKLALRSGEKILINAAAGSVGLAMTQIAQGLGARVTAIASARNHDFLYENGAQSVVDYTTTDIKDLPDKYDVIADCLGTLSFRTHRHLLTDQGRFAMVTGTLAQGLGAPIVNLVSRRKIVGGTSLATKKSLQRVLDHVAADRLKPMIERHYPFDAIRQAHSHVDQGHKRGNVVLEFGNRAL